MHVLFRIFNHLKRIVSLENYGFFYYLFYCFIWILIIELIHLYNFIKINYNLNDNIILQTHRTKLELHIRNRTIQTNKLKRQFDNLDPITLSHLIQKNSIKLIPEFNNLLYPSSKQLIIPTQISLINNYQSCCIVFFKYLYNIYNQIQHKYTDLGLILHRSKTFLYLKPAGNKKKWVIIVNDPRPAKQFDLTNLILYLKKQQIGIIIKLYQTTELSIKNDAHIFICHLKKKFNIGIRYISNQKLFLWGNEMGCLLLAYLRKSKLFRDCCLDIIYINPSCFFPSFFPTILEAQQTKDTLMSTIYSVTAFIEYCIEVNIDEHVYILLSIPQQLDVLIMLKEMYPKVNIRTVDADLEQSQDEFIKLSTHIIECHP